MPARVFTPEQRRQNDAFLEALARTGNARRAADELGVHRSTYTKRRARSSEFAEAWGRAVAAACGDARPRRRTTGGIDAAAAHTFLDALIDGATVREAAAEAGFTHPSFFARACHDPAFDRALAQAQAIGVDRVLMARIAAREADDPADWTFSTEPPPDPPGATVPGLGMSVEQALFQLMFHAPTGRFQQSPRRARNRKSPARADWPRIARKIVAHIRAVRRADHHERTGSWRLPEEA